MEQIPWDITALWRNYQINKFNQNNMSYMKRWKESICSRMAAFMVALGLWGIMNAGVLYGIWTYIDKDDSNPTNLQFFECFGPLIFYFLGTMTVIFWSCQVRVLIGPKEHFLLYYKLRLHRPRPRYNLKGAQSPQYNTPRTDWAALTNLSHVTLMDTFTFAHGTGFLEWWYEYDYISVGPL